MHRSHTAKAVQPPDCTAWPVPVPSTGPSWLFMWAPVGYCSRVKPYQIAFALPFALAFGMAAHAGVSRGVKLVLWAWSPLATGEPEAATYDRSVYHCAEKRMMQVCAAAAASGLLWLVFMAGGGVLWWWLSVLALAAVVAFDVSSWERVAVSGHYLWFQRGFRGKVHQVAMENIRDGSIEETEVRGFTLRHGTHNRLVRLNVRLSDKRVVALPKTDGYGGLEAVEAVNDYLRMRLQQLRDQETQRGRRTVRAQLDLPSADDSTPSPSSDDDLQRDLARLRLVAAQGANKRSSR